MKKIFIIRHAESISNAGERTNTHDTIPLSEKGKVQAEELAQRLDIIPDLIVVSPYSRTLETATPFIQKHPNTPIETWSVHEFTYLDSQAYKTTTATERTHDALAYWHNASIHHRNGDGETFHEFMERIKSFLKKLRTREEKIITVFSHGRFIYALNLYLEKIRQQGTDDLTDDNIFELKQENAKTFLPGTKFPIDNISIHEINLD